MKENYFEEYNRIASKIKVLRTAKHLTQEQLSELSGLSISYISKIEAPNCNKSFSLDALFILAEVLIRNQSFSRTKNHSKATRRARTSF